MRRGLTIWGKPGLLGISGDQMLGMAPSGSSSPTWVNELLPKPQYNYFRKLKLSR